MGEMFPAPHLLPGQVCLRPQQLLPQLCLGCHVLLLCSCSCLLRVRHGSRLPLQLLQQTCQRHVYHTRLDMSKGWRVACGDGSASHPSPKHS